MKRESLIYAISGTFFGLLAGWILGSQQVAVPVAPLAPPASTASATSSSTPGATAADEAPKPVDASRVSQLEGTAKAQPSNADVRTQLANLYFDANHYDQAITWYTESLTIQPNDADVSTDLGVAYYKTNQIDNALAQFQHSLQINPKHVKALFNQGIVRAFGKNDLQSAAESWQKVIDVAPESEEATLSRQALDGMRNGHKDNAAPGGGSSQD
jgi:tetratricopeptide (TPR) repeat protein